jgi:predicted ester cyclase
MTVDANKAVVRRFYEQWTSGDIDFDGLFHPDMVDHQPGREPGRGLEAFRTAIAGVMGAVPDTRWEILRMITEGDIVVCQNIWSGTYRADVFRGIPTPQGRAFSVEHVHIYRLVDNLIAEHWVARDDLGMMLQLGAVPRAPDRSPG